MFYVSVSHQRTCSVHMTRSVLIKPGAGYKSLAITLQQSNDIGQLPSSVRFSDLDDGGGI